MRHDLAAFRAHALPSRILRDSGGSTDPLPALSLTTLAAAPTSLTLTLTLTLTFALSLPATALSAFLPSLRSATLFHNDNLRLKGDSPCRVYSSRYSGLLDCIV